MTGTAEAAAAIVRLGRRLTGAGLVVGSGGNISVRTGDEQILVTPSGFALDELAPSDLVTLGLDGSVQGGGAHRPTSEAHMHLAAHRARPDAPVVVHVHPPHVTLLVGPGPAHPPPHPRPRLLRAPHRPGPLRAVG